MSVKIEIIWPTMKRKQAERFIHARLDKFRMWHDKEMFALSVDEAEELIDKLMDDFEYRLSDNDKRQ